MGKFDRCFGKTAKSFHENLPIFLALALKFAKFKRKFNDIRGKVKSHALNLTRINFI